MSISSYGASIITQTAKNVTRDGKELRAKRQ